MRRKNRSWYIARDGQPHGPISDEEMRLFVDGGHLKPTDFVWSQDMPDWQPATSVFPPKLVAAPLTSPLQPKPAESPAGKVVPQPTNKAADEPKLGAVEDPATGDARSFGNSLFNYVLRKPSSFARDLYGIISAPSDFSRRYIPSSRLGVYRSIDFFLAAITVSVVLAIVGSPFLVGSAESEIRRAVRLVIQIGAVLIPLHAAVRLLAPKATLQVTFQSILYAIGGYVIFEQFFSILLAFFWRLYDGNLFLPEDLIANEIEQCLSSNSVLYWLMRGDLRFLLDASQSEVADFKAFLEQAGYYFLIVPFTLAFGRMVSIHYSGNYIVIALMALLAFGAAKEGYWTVETAVRNSIAGDSPCWRTLPQQLAGKYQKGELLRYLDSRVDQALEWVFADKGLFTKARRIEDKSYIIVLYRKDNNRSDSEDLELLRELKEVLLEAYCSEGFIFSVLRNIDVAFGAATISFDGRMTGSFLIEPIECRSGN